MKKEVWHLANQYQFFHWHIMFPDVFRAPQNNEEPDNKQTGWCGGFDVVIGNPPWEAKELIEKEFFASKAPEIAKARTKATRSKLIESLKNNDPNLYQDWILTRRQAIGERQLLKIDKLYPYSSKGKLNTYRSFAELGLYILRVRGAFGMVLKSGIIMAQDNQNLINSLRSPVNRISIVYDFINKRLIFPGVEPNERFSLIVLGGQDTLFQMTKYAFALDSINDLQSEGRIIILNSEDLSILNPNDLSVPPLTSKRDKEILLFIHKRFSILVNEKNKENPWNIRYLQGHLNSASGSALFNENTYENLTQNGGKLKEDGIFYFNNTPQFLPVYEGKYIAQQNHRFGTFEGVDITSRFGVKAEAKEPTVQNLNNPNYGITARYWMKTQTAEQIFKQKNTIFTWLFVFRDVCRSVVDARTIQSCIIPRYLCLDGCPILNINSEVSCAAKTALVFNSLWTSFVYDYIARQKIHGAHLTKAIAYQLPTVTPECLESTFLLSTFWDFVKPRIFELTYVSFKFKDLLESIGYNGPPFMWDEKRRFVLRSEIDAAYFQIYGINRDDVDYIMETFPIVKRKDEEQYREYRTKRVILEIYDEMAEAIRTGKPYRTRLDPPPADPRVAHPQMKR